MSIHAVQFLPDPRLVPYQESFGEQLKKKDQIVVPITTTNLFAEMGDYRFVQYIAAEFWDELGATATDPPRSFGDVLTKEVDDYVIHAVVCWRGGDQEPAGWFINDDDRQEDSYRMLERALDEITTKWESEMVRPFKMHAPCYGKSALPKSDSPGQLSRAWASVANSDGDFDLFVTT